jgi:GAF domain-containing protein
VLEVINSSSGNLAPIFDAILEKALWVCSATFGVMASHDNGRLTHVAARGIPADFKNWRLEHPLEKTRSLDTALERVLAGEAVVHTPDLMASEAYRQGNPQRRAIVDLGGARSAVTVALRNDDALHGVLTIFRQEVRPFSDKEIRLLQNFAAQAVIAMENAWLLNELRESLERQTATSEVLGVISKSPGESSPVFDTILENATRICEAKFGTLFRYEDGKFLALARRNMPPALAALAEHGWFQPRPNTHLYRVMQTNQVSHTADYAAIAPDVAPVRLAGARSTVDVPMLKDGMLMGAISIYRQEVRPFTDKQIELLENFAAQAVIAIENARLLNELRQRTTDLTESLEQQTATSEVLRVISSSPGNLAPVFHAMLEKAIHICEAKFGVLFRFDGKGFQLGAEVGASPKLGDFLRQRGSFQPAPGGPLSRVLQTKHPSYTNDYAAEAPSSPAVTLDGARSTVDVPMLKDGQLLGAISIYRQEVHPFTEKQIAILTSFAAQAVIAIENTRLLNELRQRTADLTESLEQQTATSEVLRVISTSPGDLEPVFRAMLENATRICEAEFGILFRFDGTNFHPAAQFNTPAPLLEEQTRRGPYRPLPGSHLDRVMQTKRVSHTADITAEPVHGMAATFGGARSLIIVPVLKDDALIGAIVIFRQEVRPFTDKQIALVQTFRRSSLLRTHGSLMNYANRCNSRPPPPTYLKSSAARRSICRLSSIPLRSLWPVCATLKW